MTIQDVLLVAYEAAMDVNKHPSLRQGQAFFNKLYDKFPKEAEKIRATAMDPFYLNNRTFKEMREQLITYLCSKKKTQ